MTLLDRYLFGRVTGALVRTLFALVSIYILIDLLTHRREGIAALDIPWTAVAQYYLSFAPQVAYRMAPLAMLVSALLVLGDAAQNNEVTAALAGGISLRRFARMPIVVALLLSAVLFVGDQTVGASAARRAAELERYYFVKSGGEREGISWGNLSGHWTVHIGKFNRTALTGEDVIMHAFRPEGIEHIQARRIYWDDTTSRWLLEDGLWDTLQPGGGKRTGHKRITQLAAPIEESPDRLFALESPPETKTTGQLAADVNQARKLGAPTDRAQVDFHTKFSQPVLSFVMVWLAIPFALRLRRGGLAISFGTSIAIALVYLVVFIVCTQLGYIGRIHPFFAAWLANFLFLAGGLVLFWRTPT
ncbi:MAG: LptF/LptG family permease [FCB group bacterium]|jgi:lipopolysaccharide export system permease protein|nr:LptF/LptG family permease [FCB group bacterium]